MPTEALLNELLMLRVQQSLLRNPPDFGVFSDIREGLEEKAEVLKAELATRPHIPRRWEKKRQRQENARKFRGQGKSRNK